MPEHRPPPAGAWLSATASAPRRLGHADDRTTADDALRRVAEIARAEELPVVVLGDLNLAPDAPAFCAADRPCMTAA